MYDILYLISQREMLNMDLKNLPSYENDERGYIGWNPQGDYMYNSNSWSSTLEYDNWQDFISEFKDADDDLNVIVNFYFEQNEYDYYDNKIPVDERVTSLNMWLLHPKRGASRGVHVGEVTEDDLPEIREYMRRQFNTVKNWFAWVNK